MAFADVIRPVQMIGSKSQRGRLRGRTGALEATGGAFLSYELLPGSLMINCVTSPVYKFAISHLKT